MRIASLLSSATEIVCALDANSYCSRPVPRVVDGIEPLAALFHPQLVLA